MKKILLIANLIIFILILASCNTIKKSNEEKQENGFIEENKKTNDTKKEKEEKEEKEVKKKINVIKKEDFSFTLKSNKNKYRKNEKIEIEAFIR